MRNALRRERDSRLTEWHPCTSSREFVLRYSASMDRISRNGRRAEQVLICLSGLSDVCDGGEISELEHALQTATRAERSAADDELILAALCHDVGKIFGDSGHGEVAAELLKPHVRAEVVSVVRHHGSFTARHWNSSLKGDSDPRLKFRDESASCFTSAESSIARTPWRIRSVRKRSIAATTLSGPSSSPACGVGAGVRPISR
jgi:hypothetical protein